MTGRRAEYGTALVVLAAAALACGPVLLSRGYVLVGDMTFVPDQPWKDAWLGLDGSAPRAVPADALVSLVSVVVPGDLLQKAILLGALVLAGLGMVRLARALGVPGTAAPLAAGVLYLWNPYVHERLAIGHWGLVIGYATLPWVVVAARRFRRAEPGDLRRSLAGLCLALAPAALSSPTGGLLAALVVVVLVAGRRRAALRRTAAALTVVVLLNLPWLLPGLLGAETGADPGGVDAFAARSDTPFGTLGSLLTLGGIWKRSIVPGERGSWFLVLLALALSVAALGALLRRRGSADRARLAVLAAIGIVLAGLPATGVGGDLVGELVRGVPGAGVLRDSQKWIALAAPGIAAGFALVVAGAGRWLAERGVRTRVVPVAFVVLPVILLPSLAWGLAGAFRPVQYPSDWAAVRSVLEAEPPAERRTVVLPFSAYQGLAWNDRRAALDPAIRFFPGQVVTNDELTLSARTSVAGDSAEAARIAASIARGEPLGPVLAALGVRFVLVQKTASGADGVVVPAGQTRYDGAELTLVDTGNTVRPRRSEHRGLIVAGDVLTVLSLLTAGGFSVLQGIRRKKDESG